MRDDRQRLLDILEAISHIEKFASRGHESFSADELVRTWIAYHLQVIGEAAANLSAGLKQGYSEIPWSRMVGMRNILVHQYFGIDWKEVWKTAMIDVPVLKRSVQRILEDLPHGTD